MMISADQRADVLVIGVHPDERNLEINRYDFDAFGSKPMVDGSRILAAWIRRRPRRAC